VTGHRPIYSTKFCDSNGNPTGDCATLQKTIEALLYKCVVYVDVGAGLALCRVWNVWSPEVNSPQLTPASED
jgi:hypothetical protein